MRTAKAKYIQTTFTKSNQYACTTSTRCNTLPASEHRQPSEHKNPAVVNPHQHHCHHHHQKMDSYCTQHHPASTNISISSTCTLHKHFNQSNSQPAFHWTILLYS